ncbi:Asp-tRNA(Asn)/Glu-tRNA(Gln) amidotransferase subunit GatC [Candidatus Shapirobacteria bacterium]|nr:Asp-tRNA(Asn)/Glu-tRNA(Gln) amidotransferase subunit GatC [Candidatus Shapirobacteria bacterium]
MEKKSKVKSQKSKLTEGEVVHVANLAHLALAPKEIKKIRDQLSEVLDYVKILQQVDTVKIVPTSQVTGLKDVFREDSVQPSLSVKDSLSESKNSEGEKFKVKSIFQ